MSHDTLTASLVICIDEMQQPPPPSGSRENFEPGIAISVRPENTTEELLVCRSDEALALSGGPSQRVLPVHGPSVDPQGAAAPPNVFSDVQYKCSDVSSLLPKRIVGSSPDTWGTEGDECIICLGAMVAGEHVSDLPVCYHTFHLGCAVDWLKARVEAGQLGCCPVCNAEIFRPASNGKTPASRRRLHEPRLDSLEPPSSFALGVFKFFVIVLIVTSIAVIGLVVQGVGQK